MAESSHNQFPCESYISTKQMQKIKARSLPNELMSFVARNKNLVEQNVLSNNGNLSPMPDNKEIIVTVDEKPVFYKPKIKVVALEEHSTIQDGTQPINVNTRFNSLILQKNIKTSGNLDTNETALTNEVNCHQNVNNTTDNLDQNDRIEVVVSDSPSHSVRKKIYQDGDSDSDEEENYGDEIPDDLTEIDDNLTEEVLQCIDLMLKESSERLKIPLTNTVKAYHPPPDCSSCTSTCKPVKNYFNDITKKLSNADSKLDQSVLHEAFLILYRHAKSCDKSLQCQMPLCGSLIEGMKKVAHHENRKIIISIDEVFEVYERDDNSNVKEMVYGSDFIILWSEFIEKGAYGKVYSSWLRIDKRESKVAIKVLGENGITEKLLREFYRLIDNWPKLNYFHICTPHLMLKSDTCLLQIMPLGGKTLDRYLNDLLDKHERAPDLCLKKFHFGCNAGMSISQVLHYYPQILKALSFLHDEQGLMHGDVKPDNVILQENGVLQLIDLDSVRPGEAGSRCGTAGFAGPEVYQSQAECKSDIHSVACILPAMLGLQIMTIGSDWNGEVVSIIEKTNKRNEIVYKIMCLCPDLDRFADLFKRGTTADVRGRPNIEDFLKAFNNHNTVLRRTIEPKGNITTIQIKSKDYGSDAANIFRNWMIRRLPHYT